MTESFSKTLKIVSLGLVFLLSLIFFIYFTFPYGVLKEALRGQITQATGLDVRMGSLGPKILIGIAADDVEVRVPGVDGVLKLKQLKGGISLLSFLFGRLAVDFRVKESTGGTLDGSASFGLLGLIRGNEVFPRNLEIQSEKFSLTEMVKFVLTMKSSDANVNPMIAPLLKKIGFNGDLNSNVDISLDASDPTKSKGKISIKLAKAVLKLNDPAFNLPDQEFSKAQVIANMDNGVLNLDPSSGLTAPELDLSLKGKVTLKPNAVASLLDISLGIKLDKGLKDSFGFLIDAFTGSSSNGEVSLQVRGPLGAPNVTKF